MEIVMIGAGYVGLVTGACFAEFGNNVWCIDKDKEKIEKLRQGKIPIYERGLEDLVQKNVESGRLEFTHGMDEELIARATAIFIAVGTPTSRRGEGYADLSYVYGAAIEIAPLLRGYTVIVDKSTVPVGTAQQVERRISETNPEADFDMVSNPEFLREGSAIEDFMRPNRVVIGVESKAAEDVMRELYKPLYLFETPMVVTNLETAELIKYAANAFLAVKISFINEMSALCEAVGADVVALAKGIGLDRRIGGKFLHPGPGYGGSCFPKDTDALIVTGKENDAPLRIVEAAVGANSTQKVRMVRKIRQALGGSEAGKTIAVLGLTFKPETDDMREAPALTIISALTEKGAIVRAYDPQGMKEAEELLPELVFVESSIDAVRDADCVVIMTEWNEFRAAGLLDQIREVVRAPVLVDLRNIFDPEDAKKKGFRYFGVGRN